MNDNDGMQIILALLLCTASVDAADEITDQSLTWPSVSYFYFNQKTVGWTRGNDFFELDKTSSLVKKIPKPDWVSRFGNEPNDKSPFIHRTTTGLSVREDCQIEQMTGNRLCKTTDLLIGNTPRRVAMNGLDLFNAQGRICAIEQVDQQLWIATCNHFIEGPTLPADGLWIVPYDAAAKTLRPAQVLDEAHGLSHNLVHTIQLDPSTGNVWIATPRAVHELSKSGAILRSFYVTSASSSFELKLPQKQQSDPITLLQGMPQPVRLSLSESPNFVGVTFSMNKANKPVWSYEVPEFDYFYAADVKGRAKVGEAQLAISWGQKSASKIELVIKKSALTASCSLQTLMEAAMGTNAANTTELELIGIAQFSIVDPSIHSTRYTFYKMDSCKRAKP